MGWERINGKRYFYETTYIDGERIRKCWGNGPVAEEAAARVARERQERKADMDRIREYRARDAEIDSLIAGFNLATQTILQNQFHCQGFRFINGKWRKQRTI